MPPTRLTPDVIMVIWADPRTTRIVAKEYGTTGATVSNIRCGKTHSQYTGGAHPDWPNYRDKATGMLSQAAQARHSVVMKEVWQDTEIRERISAAQSKGAKKRWGDPDKRAALLAAIRESHARRRAERAARGNTHGS